MSSNETPSRNKPSLFNADLFATPSTTTGLSSLGFGDDIFAGGSPFTLVPAGPVEQTASSTSIGSTISQEAEELSTVPLDSPISGNDHHGDRGGPTVAPGSVHGWNDPPYISSIMPLPPPPPTSHQSDIKPADNYTIQPLLQQRASESPQPSVPLPPQTSVASEGGGNPYRLGGKRPTGSGNLTPAYVVPQTTSSPPTALPSSIGGVEGTTSMNRQPYVAPVQPHWFYLRSNEEYWFPFSVIDSSKLEEAYIRSQADESLQMVIPTDGGRYDVSLKERRKHAIYWDEPIANVRRCTWFYKGNNHHWYMPYDEDTADKLEETFVNALINNNWNCQVTLSSGEVVIMHSPVAMAHYPAHQSQPLNYEIDYQPKSVLRGFLERDKVGFGEDKPVDHVVFVVHGAGPLSDDGVNSFKSLIDCVDDFREVAQLMLKTHKSIGGQSPTKGRVEFLPIHWHSPLLTETNIHTQVNDISPLTIGKLRDFTSKILADILLYSSPFCLQKAIDHISREMNRMMELFQQRNPKFSGDVAIMGHSVGSCIVYDLLTHQGINEVSAAIVSEDNNDSLVDEEKTEVIPSLEDALAQLGLSQITDKFHNEMIDFDSLIMCTDDDLKDISVPLGARKKLNPFIAEWKGKIHKTQTDQDKAKSEQTSVQDKRDENELAAVSDTHMIEQVKFIKSVCGSGGPVVVYPQLSFKPSCFFSLGSPIALFLTIKGVDVIGSDYQLPTCPAVYNIFHPFDPVAYRLEPLVIQSPPNPVMMPHHKGRKRFHLELYENIERVSQSVLEGIRNMWNQINEIARAHTNKATSSTKDEVETSEAEISSQGSIDETSYENQHAVQIGHLNGGNRIDHVLQEKTIEMINEYLFALSSHSSYWRSEDTALFILKQMYI